MYLMMYLDEAGKVVYTLKARAQPPARVRDCFPVVTGALTLGAARPGSAEDGAGRQAHAVGAPGAVLAGRQVLTGAQLAGARPDAAAAAARERVLTLRRAAPRQERVTCKKRFNLLPTQKPAVPL